MKEFLIKQVFVYFASLLPSYKTQDSFVKENNFGVCTVLGHEYVTMGIYSLSSFFFQVKKVFPIFIIDDGTLTAKDKKTLSKHFTVTIASPQHCDFEMKKLSRKYPFLYKYRLKVNAFTFKRKMDAYLLAPFRSFVYIDCDILFLKTPKEIQNWLQGKGKGFRYTVHPPGLFEKGNFPEYTFRKILYKYLKIRMDASFNAGLLFFRNSSLLNLTKINKILALFDEVFYLENSLTEECLLSVLFGSSSQSAVLPPAKYLNAPFEDVFWKNFSSEAESVHFSYQSKIFFFPTAVRLVVRNYFFSSIKEMPKKQISYIYFFLSLKKYLPQPFFKFFSV
jgi:hypothetical protein